LVAQPSFIAPDVSLDTDVRFLLTVTDTDGTESTDSCVVHVLWIDDTPVLHDLTIHGPDSINENSTSQYTAMATLSDNSTSEVTDHVDWHQSSPYAQLSAQGLLTTGEIDQDVTLTLTATYTYNNVSETVQQTITITDVPENNVGPAKPLIVAPYNGEVECDIQPVVRTESFSDPDGDEHGETQWQIATDQDVSLLVFDLTSAEHLTTMSVPHTLLNNDTEYFVRVRFYDALGNESDWSDVVEFTTSTDSHDTDGNGVPDDQDVGWEADLNRDGDPDLAQPGVIKSAYYRLADVNIGVAKASDSIAAIEAIETIEPAAAFNNLNAYFRIRNKILRPSKFVYGLFSYRIRVHEPGDTAFVRICISRSISRKKVFFKYDTVHGWEDYSDRTVFNDDGYSITLEVTDGGRGDSDGVANGIILDPGGLFEDTDDGDLGLDTASDNDFMGACFVSSTDIELKEQTHHWKSAPIVRMMIIPMVQIKDVLISTFGFTGTLIGLLLAGMILVFMLRLHEGPIEEGKKDALA
jgi:hypothetical protein